MTHELPIITQTQMYALPPRRRLAQLRFTMSMAIPRRIVAAARRFMRERPYDWAWSDDRDGSRTVHFGGFPRTMYYRNTEFCNLFVGEVLEAAGVDNPLRWGMSLNAYPIPADWWFEARETDNQGWFGGLNHAVFPAEYLHPVPGDIISDGGHVAIVTESNANGTGKSISAPAFPPGHPNIPRDRPNDYRRNAIIENDWGFREGSSPSEFRISRHQEVESNYPLRMQTGTRQPLQYPGLGASTGVVVRG